jgi:predicted ATP-grasp superfamily ATP-dependent carboligase
MTRVLIAGISTRAAAASAVRAGFDVTAVDGYADLDQPAATRVAPFSARAAARIARDASCDAVVYLSSFENDPAAVRALAARRVLWGNAPDVLRRVRDPIALANELRARGFAVPDVRLKPDTTYGRTWLLKPLASGGGRRIRPWRAGARVPTGSYLQERVDGQPGSIVFVAARGAAVPIAVSRQLIGEPAFGAAPYRYCGNIVAPVNDPQFDRGAELFQRAYDLAAAVSDAFDLVGVNGVDFVARDGVPYPVEVNPRWCASMELAERLTGTAVFAAHARACVDGHVTPRPHAARAIGKAIVYARADCEAGDTHGWLADASVADIPRSGDTISAGQPVCTVFAEAADSAACHAALVQRAAAVYASVEPWVPREVLV